MTVRGGIYFPRIAGVVYSDKGIRFVFDKYGRVKHISIHDPKEALEDYRVPERHEILPGTGAFGISLGDSADKVIEELGKPHYWQKRKLLQVMQYAGTPRVSFSFASGLPTITYIVIHKTGAATPEGITIGSSSEEVLSVYGDDGKIRKATFSAAARILGGTGPLLFQALCLGFCLWAIVSTLAGRKTWVLILVWTIASLCVGVFLANISTYVIRPSLLRRLSLQRLIWVDVHFIFAASVVTASGIGMIIGRIISKTHQSGKEWTTHLWSSGGGLVLYVIPWVIVALALYGPRLGMGIGLFRLVFFPLILYLTFVIFENTFSFPWFHKGSPAVGKKLSC